VGATGRHDRSAFGIRQEYPEIERRPDLTSAWCGSIFIFTVFKLLSRDILGTVLEYASLLGSGVGLAARPLDLGIFLPNAKGGAIMRPVRPKYLPTWDLNRKNAVIAERAGFQFLLSMVNGAASAARPNTGTIRWSRSR